MGAEGFLGPGVRVPGHEGHDDADGAADQPAGETAAGAEHAHDAGHHGADGKALGSLAGRGVSRLALVGGDVFILKIRFFIHSSDGCLSWDLTVQMLSWLFYHENCGLSRRGTKGMLTNRVNQAIFGAVSLKCEEE